MRFPAGQLLLPAWELTKLKTFSETVCSAVSLQPGPVLLSRLLQCQMRAFRGEFGVPYWEGKIGASSLEGALLCFFDLNYLPPSVL